MGASKDFQEQQDNLRQRTRDLGDKLYLAGLGAYSKASNKSRTLYDQCVQAGSQTLSDEDNDRSRLVLAGHGLVIATRKLADRIPAKRKELYEQWVTAGRNERGDEAEGANEFVLAGLGAVTRLRQESRAWFDTLVQAGEKHQA